MKHLVALTSPLCEFYPKRTNNAKNKKYSAEEPHNNILRFINTCINEQRRRERLLSLLDPVPDPNKRARLRK
jgi:hypothetical protein